MRARMMLTSCKWLIFCWFKGLLVVLLHAAVCKAIMLSSQWNEIILSKQSCRSLALHVHNMCLKSFSGCRAPPEASESDSAPGSESGPELGAESESESESEDDGD